MYDRKSFQFPIDGQDTYVSAEIGFETLTSPPTPLAAPVQPGSDALRMAVSRFRARLKGDELTGFKDTTYEQLCGEIMRIQSEQERNKKMINLSRIQSWLEAMQQFSKTIEVFLNVSDAVAFVWGPVKFLLLVWQTSKSG
jgi:hypothetical protein